MLADKDRIVFNLSFPRRRESYLSRSPMLTVEIPARAGMTGRGEEC